MNVRAATIQVGAGATVSADEQTEGGRPIVFEATGGDLQLSGTFRARGPELGGIIQGSATGNLTADGRFKVLGCSGPGCEGCIGLSAGGTLDTSSGSFDLAPVATCNEGTNDVCF